jgi:hypothetical protein
LKKLTGQPIADIFRETEREKRREGEVREIS